MSLGPLFPTIYPIHFTSSKHLVFSKLKTQKIPVHAQVEVGNQWFCFRQCFAHQSIYYTCLTAVYIPFLEPLQYPNNTGSEPSSSNVDRLSCLFVFAFFTRLHSQFPFVNIEIQTFECWILNPLYIIYGTNQILCDTPKWFLKFWDVFCMIGMVAGKDYVDWLNTMDTVHNFIINQKHIERNYLLTTKE